jgi:hypothetical protein
MSDFDAQAALLILAISSRHRKRRAVHLVLGDGQRAMLELRASIVAINPGRLRDICLEGHNLAISNAGATITAGLIIGPRSLLSVAGRQQHFSKVLLGIVRLDRGRVQCAFGPLIPRR